MFVYGTLKRGFSNHMRVMQKQGCEGWYRYKSDATTAASFPLFVDDYGIPYLLNRRGTGSPVKGELYDVSEEGLQALDELEGYPDRYTRMQVSVATEGSDAVQAWMYMLDRDVPALERFRLITDYIRELHEAEFVQRDKRDMTLLEDWGGFVRRARD